jgi:hypothetical protein
MGKSLSSGRARKPLLSIGRPLFGTVQERELVIGSTRWLTPLLRSESRTAVASPQVHSDRE